MSAEPSAVSSGSGLPYVLAGLSEREQITDVLLRALLALDNNDKALWESAWQGGAEAASSEMAINGKATHGLAAINSDIFDHAGALDTQHLLLNTRIDVQPGANTARVTASGLNQHFRPGQAMALGSEHFLAGATYDMELVKDASSQWRIKTWNLKTVWAMGTWAVMQSMLK